MVHLTRPLPPLAARCERLISSHAPTRPTLDCRVQIFRVRLDVEAKRALRESEVELSNFCVRP